MSNKNNNRKKYQNGGGINTAPTPVPAPISTTQDITRYEPVTNDALLEYGLSGFSDAVPNEDNILFQSNYDQWGKTRGLDTSRGDEVDKDVDARSGLYGHTDIDDWSKFEPYLGSATGPTKGIDHRKLRAQNQGLLEQTGSAIVQTVGGIGLGLIENMGRLGTLLYDDGDYENSLTRFAEGAREGLTDFAGEIYRERPNAASDISDPTWWLQLGQGLFESIGEFAATAVIPGAIFGRGAKLANALTATSANAARAGAAIATSGSLAYVEGAMSGAQVFDRTYQIQRSRGKSDEDARKRAAEAAAQTTRLNTVVNTVLNLSSVAPMFRSNRQLLDDLGNIKHQLKQFKGEGIGEAAERIKNLAYVPQSNKLSYAAEAVQEGVEELVNVWAEASGDRIGRMTDEEAAKRDARGMAGKFLDLESAGATIGAAWSEEGAVSFFSGMLGGVGQTAVMEHAPRYKEQARYRGDTQEKKMGPNGEEIIVQPGDYVYDAQGKAVDETGPLGRISSAKKEAIDKEVAFNRVKLQIADDLLTVDKKMNELTNIVRNDASLPAERVKALADQKRMELFDLNMYQAFKNGTSKNLTATFENIRDTNNKTSISEQALKEAENIQAQIQEEAASENPSESKIEKLTEQVKQLQSLAKTTTTKAQSMGLAEDATDNGYVVKAQEAIDTIKEMDKIYKDISNRFDYGDAESHQYAKSAFLMKGNILSSRKKLNKHLETLKEHESEINDEVNKLQGNVTGLEQSVKLTQKQEGLRQSIAMLEVGEDLEGEEYHQYLETLRVLNPTLAKEIGLTTAQIDSKLLAKTKERLAGLKSNYQNQEKQIGAEKSQLIKDSLSSYLTPGQDLENASKESLAVAKKQLTDNINMIRTNTQDKLKDQYAQVYTAQADVTSAEDAFKEMTSVKGRKNFIAASTKYWGKIAEEAEAALSKTKSDEEEVKPEDVEKKDDKDDKDKGKDGKGDDNVVNRLSRDKNVKERKRVVEFMEVIKSLLDETGAIDAQIFKDKLIEFKSEDGGSLLSIVDEYSPLLDSLIKYGTKISIVDKIPANIKLDPNTPAYFTPDSNTIVFQLNDTVRPHSLSYFKELLVHEAIHVVLRNEIPNKTKESTQFVIDLKRFILSLNDGKTVPEVLSNLLKDLDSKIANAQATENVTEERMYAGAYDALEYIKKATEVLGDRNGLEELITQAFSQKEFASYLHTIKSKVGRDDSEQKGEISLWERLKGLIVEFISSVTGFSKLDELTNILDKHAPYIIPTVTGVNDVTPGRYNIEGLDLMLLGVNPDGLIELQHPLNPTYNNDNIEHMTVEKFLRLKGEGLVVNVDSDLNQEYIGLIETSTSPTFLDEIIRRNIMSSGLNAELIQELATTLDERIALLNTENEVPLTETIIEDIDEALQISELAPLGRQINELVTDSIEQSKLITLLNNKVSKLLLEDVATGIDILNIDNFASKFSEEQYNNLLAILENSINDLVLDNALELGAVTSLQEVESISGAVSAILTNFSKITRSKPRTELFFKNNKTAEEVKEVALNNRQYVMIQNIQNTFDKVFIDAYNANINDYNESLGAKDSDTEGDFNIKRKLVQLIKFKNGVELTKVSKAKYDTLYEVISEEDDSYVLIPFKTANEAKNRIEVNKDDIYDFQALNTTNRAFRENLYTPDYITKMYIHRYDKTQKLPKDYLTGILSNAYGELMYSETKANDKKIKNEVKNYFGKKYRQIPAIVMNKIDKLAKDDINGNSTYTDAEVEDMIKGFAEELYNIELDSKVAINTKAVLTKFLWDLKAKGLKLEDHVRFRLKKDISVNVNKALANELNDDPSKKLEQGLLHANPVKVASGEDFIGIHNWMDLDIAMEINLGTTDSPDWYYTGHPNNPNIYHKVKGDKTTDKVYHPGVMLKAYDLATTSDEQQEILDEFNVLYSDKNGGTLTYEDLKAFGDSSNKQAKLFEEFLDIYNKVGYSETILEPEMLKQLVNFNVSGGSIDFEYDNNKRINMDEYFYDGKEIRPEMEKFLIDGKIIIVDNKFNYDLEDSPSEKNSLSATSILGHSLDDINDPSIGGYLEDVVTTDLLSSKRNRYWMLVKDLNNKVRPIALKPRNANKEELDSFATKITNIIDVFNNQEIDLSNAESIGALRKEINTLLDSKDGLFFKVPAKFGPTVTQLEVDFASIRSNKLDAHSLILKVADKNTGKAIQIIKGLDFNSGARLKNSLLKNGLTEGNIGVSLPKPENVTSIKAILPFMEVPTTSSMFENNSIFMGLNDDIANTKDSIIEQAKSAKTETEIEIEPEIKKPKIKDDKPVDEVVKVKPKPKVKKKAIKKDKEYTDAEVLAVINSKKTILDYGSAPTLASILGVWRATRVEILTAVRSGEIIPSNIVDALRTPDWDNKDHKQIVRNIFGKLDIVLADVGIKGLRLADVKITKTEVEEQVEKQLELEFTENNLDEIKPVEPVDTIEDMQLLYQTPVIENAKTLYGELKKYGGVLGKKKFNDKADYAVVNKFLKEFKKDYFLVANFTVDQYKDFLERNSESLNKTEIKPIIERVISSIKGDISLGAPTVLLRSGTQADLVDLTRGCYKL